jgi:hypothetical protein
MSFEAPKTRPDEQGVAKPKSVIHRYSYGVLRAHLTSFFTAKSLSNLSIINSSVRVGVGERENAWDLQSRDQRKASFHHTQIRCLVSSLSWAAKDRRKRTGRRCAKPRSSPTDEPKRAREKSTSWETQSSLRTGESRSQSDVICTLLSDSFDAIGTAISP